MTERNKAKQLGVDWSHCDTVLLDMDGTVLDLAFDHYFWRELVPARIASDNGVDESGYRLVVNCNEQGGQTVFHIHLHILAGRQLTRLG